MLICVRGGCTGEVVAGLGYDIRSQRAWIYDLEPEVADGGSVAPDGAMALCTKHAESTNVPQDWKLEDKRTSGARARGALGGGLSGGLRRVESAVRAIREPEPAAAEVAEEVADIAAALATDALPIIKPDAAPWKAAPTQAEPTQTRSAQAEPTRRITPGSTEPAESVGSRNLQTTAVQSETVPLEQDVADFNQLEEAQLDENEQDPEATSETPLLERAFRAVPARYSPISS